MLPAADVVVGCLLSSAGEALPVRDSKSQEGSSCQGHGLNSSQQMMHGSFAKHQYTWLLATAPAG